MAGVTRKIPCGGEPRWPKYWLIFLALDFPLSLGVIPVTWLVPAASAAGTGECCAAASLGHYAV